MRYRNAWIGLVVLLGLGLGVAQAQDEGGFLNGSDSGDTGGAADDDFLSPAEDGAADGGTPGQDGMATPQRQVDPEDVERFDDWGVRCGLGEQGPRGGCEMFQGVTRSDNDELVMRVAVAYPPREQIDAPVAVFQLPLGIHLPSGVQMQVDDNEPVRFPVQVCFQAGCRADIPLEDELLNQMKRGTEATVTIRGPRGEIELPLSMMGFTAALDRISS
ncbi:invasion associated locus B family protein [Arhodomonas sp. SL1]|uniref:invasion associated locus B family protein n=1 Tax=Arhodomonas sp. SL1 TaxID=3425691 RepID=UPI003F8844F8